MKHQFWSKVLGLILSWFFFACLAQAATHTVTTTEDLNPPVCDNNQCSLRGAIKKAQDLDTIYLPEGRYQLSIRTPQNLADTPSTGDLDLNKEITISGDSAKTTIIDAEGLGDRIFEIQLEELNSVTLKNLTLTGGNTPEKGGAVLFNGNSGSSLLIEGVHFFQNHSQKNGGALSVIDSPSTEVLFRNSALTENTAGDSGGAISVFKSSLVSILNTTISGNRAEYGGAFAIWGVEGSLAKVVSISSTITNNHALNSGGAVQVSTDGISEAHFFIGNSILASNKADNQNPECLQTGTGVTVLSQRNIIGKSLDAQDCDLSDSSVVFVEDPLLESLADNGGNTPSHALKQNNVGIDKIFSSSCVMDVILEPLSFDQRGQQRPIHNKCDFGAVEAGDVNLVINHLEPLGSDLFAGQAFLLEVKVSNQGPDASLKAMLSIELGQVFEFISLKSENSTELCQVEQEKLICDLGALAFGEIMTLSLELRAIQSGTFDLVAHVLPRGDFELNPQDNEYILNMTVVEPVGSGTSSAGGDQSLSPTGGTTASGTETTAGGCRLGSSIGFTGGLTLISLWGVWVGIQFLRQRVSKNKR